MRLVSIHDELASPAGQPRRHLEVLKRSCIILLVTAWESYIEDTLRETFTERLKKAVAPADIESAFNLAAGAWLETRPSRPTDLAGWTGDGWKEVIRQRFAEEIAALNSPSSARVRKLFQRYVGVDVSDNWHWRRCDAALARKRLDDLLELRGTIVHNGKKLFEDNPRAIRKKEVDDAQRLLSNLVARTDIALGRPKRAVDIHTGDTRIVS